ncbi:MULTISPECIES: response regulator transcription factor [Streptomyces violaceusniger group]|uniref:Response regulator transcription factor n=1 Tax=Streptomyces rhizosphaericus TaxID=114699 RepID=A0ABN1SQL1_9ACTN|nr:MULTISPECIES: response regulator transcription factor [Streptomyces violaceusniger group]
MRILVVEDDRRPAELLRRGLAGEGYAVDVAFDGPYGLELATTNAYDVAVLAFSFVALTARLRALIRRGQRERPAAFEVGNLHIDPAARRCSRGEAVLALTAREFSVLEYLARRRGEVVANTEVLEHVWDNDFDGDINIVEVYISALRRKIDAPYGVHTIHTVRGCGYRLEPGPAPA